MAKPMLIFQPKMTFFDNTGVPLNGGKIFIYLPGTTTKQNTYTDSTLLTANPNPVILNSAGRPSNSGVEIDMYIGAAFKMVVAPSTDTDPPTNALWTEDNVTTLGQLVAVVNKTANYTVLATDRDKLITCDTSAGNFQITLLAAATAGAGFNIKIKKSDNTVNTLTIQANAAELIDFSNTSVTSSPGNYIELYSDGVQWWTARSIPQTLLDIYGNIELKFTSTLNGVNYFSMTNGATGVAPILAVEGSDANINMDFQMKGSSGYRYKGTSVSPAILYLYEQTTNGSEYFALAPPASLAASYVYTLPSSQASAGQNMRHSSTAGILVHKSEMHFENMQAYTASGTFNVPADVDRLFCTIWGAGGGGGGSTSGTGSAGGGGSYVEAILTVTPGAALTVTIGAGGLGVNANTASAGSTGGSTSIASSIIAVGGGGGPAGTTGAGGVGGAAASCTVPSGGYALSGSSGGASSSAVNSIPCCMGGSSPKIGSMATSVVGQSAPANTGAGGNSGTASVASAVGSTGLVVIYY